MLSLFPCTLDIYLFLASPGVSSLPTLHIPEKCFVNQCWCAIEVACRAMSFASQSTCVSSSLSISLISHLAKIRGFWMCTFRFSCSLELTFGPRPTLTTLCHEYIAVIMVLVLVGWIVDTSLPDGQLPHRVSPNSLKSWRDSCCGVLRHDKPSISVGWSLCGI